MKKAVFPAAVLLAVIGGLFIWRGAANPRPNVVLIVVDTLRRDHVGIYGYGRPSTPAIDALADRNVLFTNAYSNANWTKPAIASLFTGLYVGQHGVKYVVTSQTGDLPSTQRLPEDALTLAEALRRQGYFTMAVVENVHVSAKLGFSQGFDLWDEEPYGATNVTNAFIYHLGRTRAERGKSPIFAYVHYFDPHAPYYRKRYFETEGGIAPGLQEAKSTDYRWTTYTFGLDRGIIGLSPVERQRLTDLYDGEIRDADTGIARILKTLQAEGLYDESLIIVTSDHGENLGENGRFAHPHDSFSNHQVRIPLVMAFPKRSALNDRVVTGNVSIVDVYPTVLAFTGQTTPEGLAGRDMLPAVAESRGIQPQDVIAESESGSMILSQRLKYFCVPTMLGTFEFLYDQAADPLEERNLASSEKAASAALAASYRRIMNLARAGTTVKPDADVELSKEEVERMKSVGYLH